MATLEAGTNPQKRPLTGTITLIESVETTYLTHTYLETSNQEGGTGREGARICNDSPKYKANDTQRSAGSTVCAMQCDTTVLQISKGPPRKSRIVKGATADCIGLSLTLPKSYLATFNTSEKFRTNITSLPSK